MKRSWPVYLLAAFCAFLLPLGAAVQTPHLASPAASMAAAATGTPPSESPVADVPAALQDLMQRAQRRYLEGSNLIKSGESAKARAEFNKAIDMLLESEWDLAPNTSLNRFFQELIRKIHQDESRYLQPEELTEEKAEGAVVDELAKLELVPIKVDPTLKDLVEADLASTRYDIPIVLNEQVLQSMNFWLNKGKKYFTEGLIRSGRYRELIERIFREESIPLDLMYLAQVESLFKTNALSRARAKGIWQFGRGTALRYGLKVNSYVDERSDPEKSTRAAAKYLNDLYAMFKDWDLVLAAYNWGEGKVQRLIDRSGRNSFWDLIELRRNFPKETKNHVPLIQASIILGRNPEKYGFPKELDVPLTYDRVAVSKAIDLRAAAKLMSISLEELKRLNPALRGLSTPTSYPNFELRIPAGTDIEITQKIAALPAVKIKPPSEFPDRYKIQSGDTLTQIALRFHTTVAALQAANDIKSPKLLRVGGWIRVSAPSSARRSASKSTHIASKRIPSTIKSPVKGKGTTIPKAASNPARKASDSKQTPPGAKPKPLGQNASAKAAKREL
jgi:membrane-bound lytic murein transglycosylase D